jgi:nucleoside-diphosphate-sugar epimerase
MRALVTGGAGFVGQWLTRSLLERGDSVDLTGLGATFSGPNVLTADERSATRWIPADMRSADDIDAAVAGSAPDIVFHLAGVSFPPEAERSPTTTYDVNVLGAVRLLGAIQRRVQAGVLDPMTLIVGSGMQYGPHSATAMPRGRGPAVLSRVRRARDLHAKLQPLRRGARRRISASLPHRPREACSARRGEAFGARE